MMFLDFFTKMDFLGSFLAGMGTGALAYVGLKSLVKMITRNETDCRLLAVIHSDSTESRFREFLDSEEFKNIIIEHQNCTTILFETFVAIQRFDLATILDESYSVTSDVLIGTFFETVNKNNIGDAARNFFLNRLSEQNLIMKVYGNITLIESIVMLSERTPLLMELAQQFTGKYSSVKQYIKQTEQNTEQGKWHPIFFDHRFIDLRKYLTGIDDELMHKFDKSYTKALLVDK